jgi:hypothetical protein
LCFYEKYWGVPLPQEHISLNDGENEEEDGGENDDDVLPATPPPIIDTPWAQVFIRADTSESTNGLNRCTRRARCIVRLLLLSLASPESVSTLSSI